MSEEPEVTTEIPAAAPPAPAASAVGFQSELVPANPNERLVHSDVRNTLTRASHRYQRGIIRHVRALGKQKF